jgi:hypothetical protein
MKHPIFAPQNTANPTNGSHFATNGAYFSTNGVSFRYGWNFAPNEWHF